MSSSNNDSDVWLIGEKINEIPETDKITKKQVLQCFFGDFFTNKKQSDYLSAKNVAKKVIAIAEKAKIQVVHVETCTIKIQNLYYAWFKLRKNKTRDSATELRNREKFLTMLSEEFSVEKAENLTDDSMKKQKATKKGVIDCEVIIKKRVSNFFHLVCNFCFCVK